MAGQEDPEHEQCEQAKGQIEVEQPALAGDLGDETGNERAMIGDPATQGRTTQLGDAEYDA